MLGRKPRDIDHIVLIKYAERARLVRVSVTTSFMIGCAIFQIGSDDR